MIPEIHGLLALDTCPLFNEHPEHHRLQALREQYNLEDIDEVWVCSTAGVSGSIADLRAWQDARNAQPVLRIWQLGDTAEAGSHDEARLMRELIYRLVLKANVETGQRGRVYLSLAGGRKTMSADLQTAGSLFGCTAQLHVITAEPMPQELRSLTPEQWLAPLSAQFAGAVVPLVVGSGKRNDLLDIDRGRGPVTADRFPVDAPAAGEVLPWIMRGNEWLVDVCERRINNGKQLIGDYLEQLVENERHENWRSLYRLRPALIDYLRQTPLATKHRALIECLPKAELHCHIGGILDLDDQIVVGRAIWDALAKSDQRAAFGIVQSLLNTPEWPWNWIETLKQAGVRSHNVAALLVHATTDQLKHNLFETTAPRLALITRHPKGFAAYERPGELTGSAVLTHPAALAPYARGIVSQARLSGLRYLKLRGSPGKYRDRLDQQVTFLQDLAQAIRREAKTLGNSLDVRFILISDRRTTDVQAWRSFVELATRAHRETDGFVVGVDIAGDEKHVGIPAEKIARLFEPLYRECIPVTIHSGEGEAAEKIWEAAYHLNADRIGHGLTLGGRPELIEKFRNRGICLELCPTSNLEVVGYRDPSLPESEQYQIHPLLHYWRNGLPLSICTDNPGISRTDATTELLRIARMTGGQLTLWDALSITKQGFAHAFLPATEKERLLKSSDSMVYQQVTNWNIA